MTHERFLKQLRERNASGPFGYGVTTADVYVRRAIEENDAYHDYAYAATIKQASEIAVCSTPDMVMEKAARDFGSMLPKGIEAPPNTLMVFQHVVTTNREDRDKDVLHTDGAALDPKAPLLLHHMHTLPVGKVLAELEHTGEVLRVVSVLLDMNETTEDAAKLIEADVLRFSHGFRVLKYEERKEEGDNGHPGFDVLEFEIMEVSLVSVPSNVDAAIELWSRGKLKSDVFRRHAKSAFDLHHRIIVPGIDLSECDKGTVIDVGPDIGQESATIDEIKSGRILSSSNLAAIKDVRDDLAELMNTELTRAQKALIRQCVSRLEEVIAKADQDDDGKATEPIEEVVELDLRQAVLLMERTELQSLSKAIDAVLQGYKDAEHSRAYRELCSQ